MVRCANEVRSQPGSGRSSLMEWKVTCRTRVPARGLDCGAVSHSEGWSISISARRSVMSLLIGQRKVRLDADPSVLMRRFLPDIAKRLYMEFATLCCLAGDVTPGQRVVCKDLR